MMYTYKDFDEWFESGSYYQPNKNNSMNFFHLQWADILGAVVRAVLSAVLAYLVTLTSLATLSWTQIGFIALITGASSLLTQLGTSTQTSKFAGFAPVR